MNADRYKYKLSILRLSIALVLLILGIFFRVANLEDRIFWVDEVATAVRVSGYTIPEVSRNLARQDIIDRDKILKYQKLDKNRGLNDVITALKKSPEHAPLYFLITRFWLQIWGSSIATIRSISVILSFIIFPCLYWLYQELFENFNTTCLGMMLMSVSPFYVVYAQEARPYSLWTIAILVMGASFIKATRTNNYSCWLLYGFSLIFGFYTSLLSIFIAIAQGIYLFFIKHKYKAKLFKNYLLALLFSLAAFAPWISNILQNLSSMQDNTSWMRSTLNIANIIAVWIGSILLIFGDLYISPDAEPILIAIVLIVTLILLCGLFLLISRWEKLNKRSQTKIVYCGFCSFICCGFIYFFGRKYLPNYMTLDLATAIGAIIALFILILATYSIYFLIKETSPDRWLFILSSIVAIPLPLLLADIINKGQSSATPRYLIPLQLGIQIAAAFTLSRNLNNSSRKSFKSQSFWKAVTIGFIALGIFSCMRNFNQSPMYQKGRNINNPAIAKIINKSRSPLVLVESNNAMDALSLAHSLSPQVKFKVIDSSDLDAIVQHNDFDDTFILKLSSQLKNRIQSRSTINLQQVYQPRLFSDDEISLDLWKIKQ